MEKERAPEKSGGRKETTGRTFGQEKRKGRSGKKETRGFRQNG